MAATLRSFGAVLGHALRLLVRHWPELVLIYLVGAAFHNGLLWFCVWLSEYSPVVATLVLPLVAISTLVALVLMLRTVAPSLTHVNNELPGEGSRTHRRLLLLAGTLIPFLTVYAAQGYLKEDGRAFVNAAVTDELLERSGSGDFNVDRAFGSGWLLGAIVVGAFMARWLFDRFDLPEKAVWWGLAAAYVEVLWVWLLAKTFTDVQGDVTSWVKERRFTEGLLDRWDSITAALGPPGTALDSFAGWLGQLIGSSESLILLPVAWLTVAAVVHGRSLSAPSTTEVLVPPKALADRVGRVPKPVQRAAVEATESVRGRFSTLVGGVRLLAIAGLGPMLLFCFVFLLSKQVEYGTDELIRWIVGPRDFRDALSISPYTSVISRGVHTVLLVALLGAAVDRILGQLEAKDSVEPTATEASVRTD